MTTFKFQSSGIYDESIVFVFRNKNSGNYVGYDGFDTDFAKGVSDCIDSRDVIAFLNTKLITKTRSDIIDLLSNKPVNGKEWKELGGIANLEIVQLTITIDGNPYSPSALLSMLTTSNSDVDLSLAYPMEDDDEDRMI